MVDSDRIVVGSLRPALEKMAMYAGLGRKTICQAQYLMPGVSQQQMGSLLGQRLAFLRFHAFMFDLADEQCISLHKAARHEAAKHHDEKFVDVSLIEDASAYQVCLRGVDAFNSDAVAQEIVESFERWRDQATHFPEVTSDLLIARSCELLAESSK